MLLKQEYSTRLSSVAWRGFMMRERVRLVSSQKRFISLTRYLVTPQELNEALESQNDDAGKVVPMCASWFLPNDPAKRTGIDTYMHQRIKGARFFDLDTVKDDQSDLPHMLPNATTFANAMSEMGIANSDRVVVYDTKELGIFSAPRVGWMLKILGHDRVHVLNNFRLWVEQGFPTESGERQRFKPTNYIASKSSTPSEVIKFEDIRRIIESKQRGQSSPVVVDARPAGRWHGTDAEPRPGLPSGHMPGSVSLQFMDVLDGTTKALLPPHELKRIFEQRGVSLSMPVISSCGTGVTAAVLDAALQEAGHSEQRHIYDGSWTEWAQRALDDPTLIEKVEK